MSSEVELASPAPEATPPEDAPSAPPPPPKRRRWLWLLLGLLGIGVLFVFFIGSVELLHFTESEAFCTSCHVMHPEEQAYGISPHARTDCGKCHIGPGALAAFKAKLANARYLWVYPTNSYERPIPSPIHSLRPVEVVCEQCHWPGKFYEDRVVVVPQYAEDTDNSLTQTVLAMKTGGKEASGVNRGIHWHIENPVYYIATDEKRQEIPWVQAEYNGVVTEYVDTESSYTPEELATMEKRKMDCVDCHNRASHNFRRPQDALDQAIAQGVIPADLPEIKKQGVAVLERQYATEDEAAAAIAAVEDFYKTQYPDVYTQREADVKAAVAGLQSIFDVTQFPYMNLTWDSHKNNIGHKNFPGCFRCHDGKHLSVDNQAIRLECNICHSIPQVADPGEPLPPVSVAPSMPQPASHQSTTWLAEHRYQFDASCAECHTVDNPGGSDNSSFCSNSACHATEWKYAGLNAPKIRELSAPVRAPGDGQPKPIPHPISANTNCVACHGPDGVHPFPESHAAFTPDMCTGCHTATLQEATPTTAPTAATQPENTPEATATSEASATSEATATPRATATSEATATAEATDENAGPPGIPHAIVEGTPCTTCHGPDGIRPFPATHVGFNENTCTGCHQPMAASDGTATPEATTEANSGETAGPPAIPHDLTGRDNCLACHDPDSGVRPAPSNHAGRTVESCQGCHKPES